MTNEQRANKILGYDEDEDSTPHEFWRSAAPRVLVDIQRGLIDKGLTEEEANDAIRGVWSTCSEEYGN